MNLYIKSIKLKAELMKSYTNAIALACCVLIVSLFGIQSAHAIKKCKDADGKWHYGDVAVRACEDSKVTTLSDRGFIKAEKAAPKTEAQLAAEESLRIRNEEDALEKEKQELEKTRILSVYETEADIDRQRDNQLYSVDSNIAVHNTYLESLKEQIAHEQKKISSTQNVGVKINAEKKIAEAEKNYETYSSEVVLLEKHREEIITRFDKEKLVYRELTKAVSETE